MLNDDQMNSKLNFKEAFEFKHFSTIPLLIMFCFSIYSFGFTCVFFFLHHLGAED